jgi:hypothetical protein
VHRAFLFGCPVGACRQERIVRDQINSTWTAYRFRRAWMDNSDGTGLLLLLNDGEKQAGEHIRTDRLTIVR